MSNEEYWWDLPLVFCSDNAMDDISIRSMLERAVKDQNTDKDIDTDADFMDLTSVDFKKDDQFDWTVKVPSDGKVRVILVNNPPDNWDIPQFENYFLTEWASAGDPGKVYLALLPPPAPASMSLEEFWADQVLPHDCEADDLGDVRLFTRHGWVVMKLWWVEKYVRSIGMDVFNPDEEMGEVITKYRSEPSASVLPFLTD
ncbi:uncharacterized protein F4807DRAFT_459402 [Annulohypoxylon truncatum]|uniref:uncharacterized protein n=1 Tax=Annulohypoxylon truncatum TaxID=327061 RepID=UPI002008DBE1|nr:uncharacterized protein F4807DRAFT_459402 [Annulohypoxylon truncatum]KAI1210560.1 hypothetical protein F4807DRAFT_459402 [Annulohypoxylon truncatum]